MHSDLFPENQKRAGFCLPWQGSNTPAWYNLDGLTANHSEELWFHRFALPSQAQTFTDPYEHFMVWNSGSRGGDYATRAGQFPGRKWFIGNEPDNYPDQGYRTPAQYAGDLKYWYDTLKAADATCQVYWSGLFIISPGRIRWMEAMLTAYQSAYGVAPSFDGIHIHNYIEPEFPWGAGTAYGVAYGSNPPVDPREDIDAVWYNRHISPTWFKQGLLDLRQWMAGKGWQSKPVIISEYGDLLGAWGQAAAGQYLYDSFNIALDEKHASWGNPNDQNRLCQGFLWFHLSYDPGEPVSHQQTRMFNFGSGGTRTVIGDKFAQWWTEHFDNKQLAKPDGYDLYTPGGKQLVLPH